PAPEAHDIFKRFAKEFEQTYTRFLDLQKAEAQAREAQIQLALERVRARTMAMQKSEELLEAGELLCNEMNRLGIHSLTSGYVLFDADENIGWNYTPNPGTGKIMPTSVGIFHRETDELRTVLEYWKSKKLFSVIEMDEEQTIRHQKFIAERSINFPLSVNELLAISPKRLVLHNFNFKEGYIMIVGSEKLSDEQVSVMLRFANVFQQTYTRFLDLQKAESQAREATIEAALERVRSKTMAMHNSNDVGETVATMFTEFVYLGIHTNRCGILIFYEDNVAEVWTAKSNPEGKANLIIGRLDLKTHQMLNSAYDAWKSKKSFFQYGLQGEDIVSYYETINRSQYYPVKFDTGNLPAKEFHTDFFFPEGAVFAFTNEPIEDEHSKIFKRFAGVFGQTYRRYLDLLKAEAQAKEALIEAGLERLRARTMAMHNSEDVSAATATMFTELEKLGVENLRCGIAIIHKNKTQEVWSVSNILSDVNGNLVEKKNVIAAGTFDMNAHPLWQLIYEKWDKKEDFVKYYLADKDKEDYFKVLNTTKDYLPQAVQQFPDTNFQVYFFGEGAVWSASLQPHSDEHKQIMRRFTSVFSLTFRRYLDLQKAEAQAREAEIQLALERVRARSLAMHQTSELQDVVNLVAQQLHSINIDINGGVCITVNDEVDKDAGIPLWASSGAVDYVKKVVVPFWNHPIYRCLKDAIKKRNNFLIEEYSREEKIGFFEHLFKHAPWKTAPPEGKKELLLREGGYTRSVSISNYTSIAIINDNGKKFSNDDNEILKRFGKVFEQTYTR
ncbi:MAG TPA: hypothetical protein VLS85_06240, partial [Hanamia sp.]|nr:hypothetical protein [Hanamia sp.]